VGTESARAAITGPPEHAVTHAGHSRQVAGRQHPCIDELLGETMPTNYSEDLPARAWRLQKGVRLQALDARIYAYATLSLHPPKW